MIRSRRTQVANGDLIQHHVVLGGIRGNVDGTGDKFGSVVRLGRVNDIGRSFSRARRLNIKRWRLQEPALGGPILRIANFPLHCLLVVRTHDWLEIGRVCQRGEKKAWGVFVRTKITNLREVRGQRTPASELKSVGSGWPES